MAADFIHRGAECRLARRLACIIFGVAWASHVSFSPGHSTDRKVYGDKISGK